MSRFSVYVTTRARRQFDSARIRWEMTHHEPATTLRQDFAAARDILEGQPYAGQEMDGDTTIRRYVLARAPFVVFYRVRPKVERVEFIMLVHARMEIPRLPKR